MTLEAIAKAYTTCIELEERAQQESPLIADDLSILRADLHALLMQALRDANIPFADRAHAARIAYDLASNRTPT
jgi:hypothetical protein